MNTTRRTAILAAVTCLCGVSVAQIRNVPLELEMAVTKSLQDRLTDMAHSVYDKYEGNTRDNQLAIVRELTPLLQDLKTKGQIDNYVIVCNDSNNPPAIVETGFIMLFVLWTAGPEDEGVLNRIFIGPEEAVRRLSR